MTVNLSMLAGAGAQFFDNNGIPLSGGLVYTYTAGTTTPQAAYTTSAGSIAHTNPIVLDSSGRVPSGGEIWLTDAVAYKFVLKTATATTIGTYDNVTGNASGIYAAFAASSGSSLVGYIQSGTGAVATTVQARLRQYVSVIDFGADTSGASSSSAAFTNANNLGTQVVITKGTYLLSTSVTFTVPVSIEYGAVITVPTGVTLAFNKGFNAGIYQCFNTTGTGTVTFNWNYLTVGFPEWWGAKSDGATDCYAGITACLLACQITQLQNGDYFTSDTILMDKPHRTLVGRGSQYEDTSSQVTRLLVTSNSKNTLRVGTTSAPASINDFQKQNVVQDIYISRNVAPLISSACNSVICQYTLYAELINVKTNGSIYGFQFYGNSYLKATNCSAVRDTAGTGSGTDLWYGYYIDGYASIGAAGGNASIYLNYCQSGCNIAALQTGSSFGLYADNNFTDMFIESFESVSCNVGMQILGNATTGAKETNTDCQIKNPINDAFYKYGIFIKNVNKYGSVSITEGYYGPNAAASAALYVLDSLGSVQVSGGQFVMSASTTAKAIDCSGSSGLIIDASQILDCSTAGVTLSNSSSCDIRPVVKNYYYILANAGVQLNNTCTANNIAPIVYGNASYVALGVQLVSTANVRNEINCTGIDSTCLAASSNKLQINGVSITATGLSGTNLVSGVMT